MPSILITGASRGFGFEVLNIYLEKGWDVFPLIRDKEFAKTLGSKQIKNCYPIVADVGLDSVEVDITNVLKQHTGLLDVLINNAGHVKKNRGWANTYTEDLADLFNIHCTGAFRCIRACLPFLLQAEKPVVVNISSRWGSIKKTASGKGSFIYSYNIAKAAQNMLTASFQNEFKKMKIKFLAVHPGKLFTENAPRDADTTPKQAAKKMYEWIALVNSSTPCDMYDLMEEKSLEW